MKPYEQYRIEREQRKRAEAAELARMRQENAAARERYLAGLQAQRDEQAAHDLAAQEQALAPQRLQIERQWLASHPDKSAADFRAHAWPLLRANLLEQAKAERSERVAAELRASGRYSF